MRYTGVRHMTAASVDLVDMVVMAVDLEMVMAVDMAMVSANSTFHIIVSYNSAQKYTTVNLPISPPSIKYT